MPIGWDCIVQVLAMVGDPHRDQAQVVGTPTPTPNEFGQQQVVAGMPASSKFGQLEVVGGVPMRSDKGKY